MNNRKSLFYYLDQWWQQRQQTDPEVSAPILRNGAKSPFVPTPGNMLFTLALVALLITAQSVGALPLGRQQTAPTVPSTSTIAYQGRLADADGNPLTDTVNMIFRLYGQDTGGTPLWEEQWTGSNGVRVSDGLFNVMLGSLTAIPASLITSNTSLFLGITVGTDDEMAPRVQLGTVPFAVQALTVPDGSITAEKLGPDVNLEPPDGSITTEKIADGAVTQAKLNLDSGLEVGGAITATGNIHFDGIMTGPQSYWVDYRSYFTTLN